MSRWCIACELSQVDDGVGRIPETLKSHKLDDNTLVIFTVDQGSVGGHNGFWGRGDHTRPFTGNACQLDIRLILRHPQRIPAEQSTNIHLSNYDLLPSVLDYVGLKSKIPAKLPGRSSAPTLRGQKQKWDNTVFYEFENIRSIRTDQWSFMTRFREEPNELYDLKTDPWERRNLFINDKYAKIRKQLQKRMNDFFRRHSSPKYDIWNGGQSKTFFFDAKDFRRNEIGLGLQTLPVFSNEDFFMRTCFTFSASIPLMLCCFLSFSRAGGEGDTVKVFILAGQSNMEGKAKNELFEYQATAPKTKAFFAHLRKDGKWIVRDDVFIKYLKRHGNLTLGYGSPGRTGMALEFGTVVGNQFDEPVLLIKTCWGGHSLYKNFRPPSAGFPDEKKLQKELEQAQERVRKKNKKKNRNDPIPTMKDIKSAYGKSYRMMLDEIAVTFKDYETLFPKLKGKKLQIAGFVWFQGWNDMYNGAEKEYASNMKHFINDVRKDLKAPKMPFVIALMGQNGSKPAKGAMAEVQKAQLSMQTLPEFKGNVKSIRTDVLVDKAAEKLYPTWRKNFEQWKLTGSDFGYHYMGSAIWFTRIGHETGNGMLELMGKTRRNE